MKFNWKIETLAAFISQLDVQLQAGILPTSDEAMQLCILVSCVEWTCNHSLAAAKCEAAAVRVSIALKNGEDARKQLARLERRLNNLRAFIMRAIAQVPPAPAVGLNGKPAEAPTTGADLGIAL